MKTAILSAKISKITSFIFIAFICIALATSCKKDAGLNSTASVSSDEAAEAIAEAVTPESGGMVSQVDESTAIVAANTSPCGYSFDSSISAGNPSGSPVTYSFNLSWHWAFTCATQAFQFNFTGSSVYDAPRMSSNDNSAGTITITGIEGSSSAYVVNESYVRNGTQQSKILNKNSFTSKITITSENINVDKKTEMITSGTSTVSITGSSTGGASFSYGGTIIFKGDKTAKLVLDNGSTYVISWP